MPQTEAKQVKKLEKALHDKLRLHVEAEIQKQSSLVREQVLCDLLVHQDVFDRTLTAAAEVDEREASQLHAVLLQQLNPSTAPAAEEGHFEQQQHPLPCSYVAQLLRQSTVAQVQQVLSMSAQDWADHWANLTPQFLMQLELCERSSYAESMHCGPRAPDSPGSCSAKGGGSCSSCAEHNSGALDSGWLQQQSVQLQRGVDDIILLLHLACCVHPVPFLESVSRRLDSVSSGPPDMQHWERVADRLQLTPTQAMQISVLAEEFQRKNQGLSLEGKRLIEEAAQSGLQLEAALHPPQHQHQQQQQQQQDNEAAGGRHSRHPALRDPQPPPPQQQQQQQQESDKWEVMSHESSGLSGGSQEAMLPTLEQGDSGSWHERLEQQLQTYMRKRLVLQQCMQAFMANTLSTYQIAMLVIASYPWEPSANLVAGIVSKRVQECHQQQVKGGIPQQRYSAAAGDSSDSGAGGIAGLKPAQAGADQAAKGGKLTYGQWVTRQREKARAQELALHQRACWAQLGCELPGEEQPPPQSPATQQHQQQQRRQAGA